MKKLFLMTLTLSLFFLTSCSKDEDFKPVARNEAERFGERITYSSNLDCSNNFTTVKPKVDFLFIWDNSSSQYFINEQTQKALRSTINAMSNRFDFRIVLAPLLPPSSGVAPYFIITENSNGIHSSQFSKIIPADDEARIQALASFSTVSGNKNDKGFVRVHDMLDTHRPGSSQSIFREESNLMVVLMSNDNDYSGASGSNLEQNPSTVSQYYSAYQQIKNDYNALQFRFFSLVAFQNSPSCSKIPYSIAGNYYIQMSNNMALAEGKSGDSFNICTNEFKNIFNGINQEITELLIPHEYEYWPLIEQENHSSPIDIDPNSIVVKKNTNRVLLQDDVDGYELIPGIQTVNLRVKPTPGESFTGQVIKLKGSGRVVYPECLIITSMSPFEYYGYLALQKEPNLEKLVIKINGQEITQDEANGWSFLGFKQSFNIKVQSPSASNVPGTPAMNKTGYILKLNGSAIASNSDTIEVRYVPAIK